MIRIAQLWAQQRGQCLYCESLTFLPAVSKEAIRAALRIREGESNARKIARWCITKEHLVRKIDGGGGDGRNVAMACAFCNTTRHQATVEEHRDAMQALAEAGEHPVVNAWARVLGDKIVGNRSFFHLSKDKMSLDER